MLWLFWGCMTEGINQLLTVAVALGVRHVTKLELPCGRYVGSESALSKRTLRAPKR